MWQCLRLCLLSSSSEDRGEGSLHVAEIGRYRRRRACFMIVRRLELRLLFLALDRHLTSQRLLRVFLVVGERSDRLVVPPLSWVSRFEGLIVFNKRSGLWFGCAMWDLRVLLKNLLMSVERVRLLGPL